MWNAAVTAAVVMVFDAAAKLISRAALPSQGVTLFPGIVLRVVENLRGPFGLGSLALAVGFSLFVLLFLTYHLRSVASDPFAARFVGLILGGGVATVAERIFFGRSTDFLVLAERTAVNVADVAIGLGVLGLVLQSLVRRLPVET